MSYAPAGSLNLTQAPYTPPGAGAVAFDLAAGAEQPIDLPIPRPGIMVGARMRSDAASQRAGQTRGHTHGTPAPCDSQRQRHDSQQGRALSLPATWQRFDRVPARDHQPASHCWNQSQPHRPTVAPVSWEQPTPHHCEVAQPWDRIPGRQEWAHHQFNDPRDHQSDSRHRQRTAILNWQPRLIERTPAGGPLNMTQAPYVPPGARGVQFEMVPRAILEQEPTPTRSVDSWAGRYSWSLTEALAGRTVHPWDRKPRLNTEVIFPVPQEPNGPDIEPPPEPEIKGTYVIMNASSLIALSTETPLDFKDLSISLDADSFAWSMSVRILNRASMDLIRPTASGPAEVIATINGYQWRFIVERYSRDCRFGTEQYQVSGVSRSQLLAAPYAPRRTRRIEAPINMSQLMAQQLEYTGFTVALQSGLPDFVIPADAWGYEEKTAMEVISELAAAVGAVVVPDRELDVLHIRHRYKQAGPWGYPALAAGDIDAIIADAMTTGYASQWEPHPSYNAVFVSGITAGVAVEVIRQGTAGDQVAPDVFDDLNVDSSQCRLRGLNTIAASGDQEIVTVETILPTSGAPGLIVPAMLIEYRDTIEPANTWRGNTLSNKITVSKPGTGRVTQTVNVERHHY